MHLKAIMQACALATILALSPSIAQGQGLSNDNPELTVAGTGAAEPIIFTRDELEALGLATIETTTPWNEGVVTFEGVPIADILQAAGVSGETATVMALNDYSVDIPVADFEQYGVILALKRNGEYMPTDDQGPYFVIYPFDSDPVLQGQPYHGRAVWQVKEITVE